MTIKKTTFFLLLIALPLATEAKDPANFGGKEVVVYKTNTKQKQQTRAQIRGTRDYTVV